MNYRATLDAIVYKLWYGKFRRPFRAMLRRLVGRRVQTRIKLGPLKGYCFIDDSYPSPYSLGIYELHVQYAILNTLTNGDVFYDVGAHFGFLSLLAAKIVGPEGHVYAFEPLPENAERVLQLMAANNISNYTLIPEAVSEKRGTVELFVGEDSYTPSLMQKCQGRSITVNTMTLDEFAQKNRRPNLIKVDVEGVEPLVLKGAMQLISGNDAPIWIIELHSESNDHAVTNLLMSHGYKIQDLRPPCPRQKPYPRHIQAWK